MLNFEMPLSKENFLLYAAKEYNNPQCMGVSEFNDDLKKFMYIKRLLKRNSRGKELDFRLLINHIVVLHNVFNPKALCRMIYFYCDKDQWPVITSILIYLNVLVKSIPETRNILLLRDPETTEHLKKL